jgi:hypothetical protein
MAHDEARDRVVLFGGLDANNQFLGDTWVWDGTTWLKQNPATSPTARWFAAMAFDRDSDTVVLFGGSDELFGNNPPAFGDTWTWDGTTWHQQFPATSPPARFGSTMAYDATNHRVLLYGGCCFPDHQTWAWTGTTWAHAVDDGRPPTRYLGSMAYDAATQSVLLFGGLVHHEVDDGSTWVWAGATRSTAGWVQDHPPVSPSPRDGTVLAYSIAARTVALFGGYGYGTTGYDRDTWTWDGTTWSRLTPAVSPPSRAWASMAYDSRSHGLVLFGGGSPQGFLNDTWILR